MQRAIAALLVGGLTLAGCAHTTQAERWCLVASAADVATTARALDHNRDATEANPLMTLAGEDAATVAITSALVSVAVMVVIRAMRKRLRERERHVGRGSESVDKQLDRALWACTALRGSAAAWNLSVSED